MSWENPLSQGLLEEHFWEHSFLGGPKNTFQGTSLDLQFWPKNDLFIKLFILYKAKKSNSAESDLEARVVPLVMTYGSPEVA